MRLLEKVLGCVTWPIFVRREFDGTLSFGVRPPPTEFGAYGALVVPIHDVRITRFEAPEAVKAALATEPVTSGYHRIARQGRSAAWRSVRAHEL